MPLYELNDLPILEPVEGYRVRFVHSDHMTLAYWDISAGASLSEHSHSHEQIVNVLEGEFELLLAGKSQHLSPGRVLVIPPDLPHAGRAITDCRILDAFFPVREDYR